MDQGHPLGAVLVDDHIGDRVAVVEDLDLHLGSLRRLHHLAVDAEDRVDPQGVGVGVDVEVIGQHVDEGGVLPRLGHRDVVLGDGRIQVVLLSAHQQGRP